MTIDQTKRHQQSGLKQRTVGPIRLSTTRNIKQWMYYWKPTTLFFACNFHRIDVKSVLVVMHL